MKRNQLEFPVSIYGKLERVNDVLSKARVRIFYKYGNRNGTYITDEFADELISTLPGVPVKGIYEGNDYTDHGDERSEGQVYGFVPEQNNFAWEENIDVDGIKRLYACCDVYLFTALYPEASDIVGKSQSMELFEPTLTYHWSVIHGQKYVVFEHGSFLGLQVLGDHVEPCFEGASFFSLQKQIQDTIQKIKEYSSIGGKSEMPHINFNLSDAEKFNAIWSLLNERFTEESGWIVDYSICDIYDEYAVAYNYGTSSYERIYYKKNDEEESVEVTEKVPCFIIDVTQEEKDTLKVLRHLNNDTYTCINENLIHADENATQCVELHTKIDELTSTIATLETEAAQAQETIDAVNANYANAQEQISGLSEQVEALEAYKKNIEDQHKEAVINEYVGKVPEEVLKTYRTNFAQYTIDDLDMHLAYEWKKAGISFKPISPDTQIIPKDVGPVDGVNAILARYKK